MATSLNIIEEVKKISNNFTQIISRETLEKENLWTKKSSKWQHNIFNYTIIHKNTYEMYPENKEHFEQNKALIEKFQNENKNNKNKIIGIMVQSINNDNINNKRTNEKFGMTCEKAICIVNNDPNGNKINDERVDVNKVNKLLEPIKLFFKSNKIPPLTYTGHDDDVVDFVDSNKNTYSVKSNIKKNDKVCPQVIGQPTKKSFIKKVYNIINNTELLALSDTEIKKNIFEKTNEYLNLYLGKLFCCDYMIYINDSYDIKMIDKKKFIFEKEKITFKKTLENWNESITVRYNDIDVGEFQVHNNRSGIKFRFRLNNLLSIINNNTVNDIIIDDFQNLKI